MIVEKSVRLFLCFAILCRIAWAQEESANPVVAKKQEIQATANFLDQTLVGYKALQRPTPRDGSEISSVIVTANIFIARAVWEDFETTLEVTVRQEWEDERLRYSPTVGFVTVPNSVPIWTPDTFFVTGREKTKFDELRFVRVEPTGHVTESQRYTVKVKCAPSTHSYPLVNKKTCTLKLSSWAHTFDDIAYFWRRSANVTFSKQSQKAYAPYTFEAAFTTECSEEISTGSFSCIQADLVFEGAAFEPCLYFYLPSLVLLFASWFHFFIHGSWTVPRTLSALAPFLIFASALFFLNHPHTIGITAYDSWLIFCLGMTFLSLLEYFIAICCGIRRAQVQQQQQQPSLDQQQQPLLDQEEGGRKGGSSTGCCQGRVSFCGGGANVLDCFSRIFFPLLFIAFVALYVVFYLII